ncbi:hypothetical protein Trydic_g402 [Trypoxylus dichotomus]
MLSARTLRRLFSSGCLSPASILKSERPPPMGLPKVGRDEADKPNRNYLGSCLNQVLINSPPASCRTIKARLSV